MAFTANRGRNSLKQTGRNELISKRITRWAIIIKHYLDVVSGGGLMGPAVRTNDVFERHTSTEGELFLTLRPRF